MRANVDPTIVHAIPNAIDAKKFQPDLDGLAKKRKRKRDKHDGRIKIVIVSRLVYRKGVDLLVGIIPRICAQYPNVDFIIGGDGAKKLALEEMVERGRLQDRVEFLGSVPHAQVRDVLVRGHIFLNCSLTESFCIAILEAASCGLFVVSTEVGGVPEVLPEDLIMMGAPNVEELTDVLAKAIHEKTDFGTHARSEGGFKSKSLHDPIEAHRRISTMYSWDRVATKTLKVYEQVLEKRKLTFLQRLARYRTVGPFAGYIVCMIAVSLHFFVAIIEWLQPRNQIDVVPHLKPFEPEVPTKSQNSSTNKNTKIDK